MLTLCQLRLRAPSAMILPSTRCFRQVAFLKSRVVALSPRTRAIAPPQSAQPATHNESALLAVTYMPDCQIMKAIARSRDICTRVACLGKAASGCLPIDHCGMAANCADLLRQCLGAAIVCRCCVGRTKHCNSTASALRFSVQSLACVSARSGLA